MFIVTIDIDKCQACEECLETCPNEAIAIVEEDGKKFCSLCSQLWK